MNDMITPHNQSAYLKLSTFEKVDINPLATEQNGKDKQWIQGCRCEFKVETLKYISMIHDGDKISLVYVIFWRSNTLNDYLNRCWLNSIMSRDVTRVQCVFVNKFNVCSKAPVTPVLPVASLTFGYCRCLRLYVCVCVSVDHKILSAW